MKMKLAMPMVLAMSVSGCDAVQDLGRSVSEVFGLKAPDTLVIRPGTTLSAGGQLLTVFGVDPCPTKPEGVMEAIFGPTPEIIDRDCVVIGPLSTQVRVILGVDSQRVDELWSVEREADRIRLRRANGEMLMPAP